MDIKLNTDHPFLVKLARCQVGTEKNVVGKLKKRSANQSAANECRYYGKVLGSYDVLEISSPHDLLAVMSLDSDMEMLDMASFPCFSFNGHENQFSKQLDESVIAALMLIKINREFLKIRGLKGLFSLGSSFFQESEISENIKEHLGVTGSSKSKWSTTPLIGMGHFEILLWVECDTYDQVFKLSEYLRCGTFDRDIKESVSLENEINLVEHSVTIPLISYNIISKNKWNSLSTCMINPVMSIRCIPGHDIEVKQEIEKAGGICRQIFGPEDLYAYWQKPIKLSVYLKNLLNFRKINTENNSVYKTTTSIIASESLNPDKPWPENKFPFEKNGYSERLEDIASRNENVFFIAELINIIRRANTLTGSQNINFKNEVFTSLGSYINEIADIYVKAKKDNDIITKQRSEYFFLKYSAKFRDVLDQRYSGLSFAEQSDFSTKPTFALSLPMILRAISLLPKYTMDVIASAPIPTRLRDITNEESNAFFGIHFRSYKEKKKYHKKLIDRYNSPWKGFLVLDMPQTYSVQSECEIITVPYKDIFSHYNWIIISHEISHLYATRVNFEQNEFIYISNSSFDDHKYIKNRVATAGELFVHWFDFVHFYREDFDFYLWAMWSAYCNTPNIQLDSKSYILRSLFIWFCVNHSKFTEDIDRAKHTSQSKLLDTLAEIIFKGANELSPYFKRWFTEEDYRKVYPRDQLLSLIMSCASYLHLKDVFEQYRNDALLKAISDKSCYTQLDIHANKIERGEIICDKIINPFLLLYTLAKNQYSRAPHQLNPSPTIDTSIALIFSMWESSLNY